MISCPSCGVSNNTLASVCMCGHLLETEEVANTGWETVRIAAPQLKRTFRQMLPISIWVIVGGAVIGLILADSGLRGRLVGGDMTAEAKVNMSDQTRLRNAMEVKVVAILDGESFTATDAGQNEIHLRLGGVDAPELDDYFGEQSRENLVGLIGGKTVTIDELKVYNGGLALARVNVEGRNVNIEQLRGGYAWIAGNAAEFMPSAELENYRQTEVVARSNKVGLWTRWDVVINSESGSSDVASEESDMKSEGLFTFGSGGKTVVARPAKAGSSAVNSETPVSGSASPEGTVAQNGATDDGELRADPDAKPAENIVPLKLAESSEQSPEPKSIPQSSESGRSYILGPRGGCFFKTGSGGKKYVDRSLCTQPSTASQ